MTFPQKYGFLFTCFLLCMVDSRGIAGNVKLVAMNGNQYWFSSSSPYAPHLNFHLAYQYCRTLGLQLVVLEAKEEVETISAYLNSGDGSSLNINKYWTSGNKLGADSWIWMSSGEQLNSSFSDYWLKSGNGSPTDNPKQCMSMKAPITKRAIFTSEECNKSLPFICEQVRCLYYNYPVALFPDPSELRTDIEEGTVATPTEAESRSSPSFSSHDKIRAQNFISGRTVKSPTTLSDFAAQESGRIDPSQIQRRITLRPVTSAYPYPPRYINSFYKYKSVDYDLTSTSRPAFKKTTRESLWGPSSDNTINLAPTVPTIANSGSVGGSINKVGILSKNSEEGARKTTFVTAKVLRPSNSTVSTTVETSVRADQDVPVTYTHLEIVTSRSTSIDGEEVTEFDDEQDETTLYTTRRYGDEYVSTNPTIIFDDEANNVGGESPDEDTERPDVVRGSKFFHGNGIRRPDTNSKSTEAGVTGRINASEEGSTTIVSGNREASQTHSPATMKNYHFQRSKAQINWPRTTGNRSVTSIIASTNAGPSKIRLGPRLQFKNRN